MTLCHNTRGGLGSKAAGVRRRAGFSLIEIMVVVSLLLVIVLGLMAMFNQTQRAFRQGITQTDVLESGRAAMELITRELEQMTPSHMPGVENFFVEVPPVTPLQQTLPVGGEVRTNVLSEYFFLTRANDQWVGTGYRVSTPSLGVGTLYRFVTNLPPAQLASGAAYFANTPLTNLNRIFDGIVHLRVRAYDTNGFLVDLNPSSTTNYFVALEPNAPGEFEYSYWSNAVPAFVEVELGILETRTLERFRAIPNATAQRRYLEDQVGRVHLFRQRVPVRSVDPAVYQ